MSDKTAKKKAKKASRTDAHPSVLGSLPATRPDRLGRTRGAKPKAAATTARASTPRTAAAKPRTRARSEQGAAAKPETGATSAAVPGQAPRQATPPATPPGVVTTTVQAVGEVAQIGVTLGRRFVGGALSRIPRP
jgi:hypothetical protein